MTFLHLKSKVKNYLKKEEKSQMRHFCIIFKHCAKKGVNVVPDVFKYIIMIEFVMENGQSDNFARDCMQKFRIDRMSGYAALYTDCTNRELEEIIDEESAQEFIEFQ